MVLSIIFLEDKHKMLLHLSILYEYQQFSQHHICFSIQPQLQLVNLHRNRRYFVIKLHTWFCIFCLSYFLKTNIIFFFLAFINILWVLTVFSTPYLFLDTAARLVQWPVTQISTFQQFFLLIRLFNNNNKCGHRNVLSKRQVWMSIFHIIKKKLNHGHRGPGFFLIKN
jgi:hypothetical protein